MTVRLKTDREFVALQPRSLCINRIYRVLSIESRSYRLWGNADREPTRYGPFLFDAAWFDVLDPAEPTEWSVRINSDGERNAGPASFGRHTWEEYFDHDEHAVALVNAYLSGRTPLSWEVEPASRVSWVRGSREFLIEVLRVLASPDRQRSFASLVDSHEVTEKVLCALAFSDDWPVDLNDAERATRAALCEAMSAAFKCYEPNLVLPAVEDFVRSERARRIYEAAGAALEEILKTRRG